MDVDSIPLGADFRTHLDAQVAKCHVFLAVIGRDWMKATKGRKGKSQLEDPRDFVRIEIESALKREIPVIPVLVRGASIPAAERLPASIQDLSYRNGIAIRAGQDFHRDMDRLIEYLKQQIQLFQEQRAEKDVPVQTAAEDVKERLPAKGEVSSPAREKPKRSPGAQSVKTGVEPPSTEAPAGMVKVPKGPFLYGEDKHSETIEYDYWIGRYPVTNEEFGAFISADGYQNQVYWSQTGWTWKTKENVQVPEFWNDTKWNKPDHPVVGVSFYEAEAYAKWADKRLLTEQEWEKAARGTDGRTYPWGDGFDQNKRNSGGSVSGAIIAVVKGRTSPVSKYPDGVSPYGCYDMAGNVWEWCASWHDENHQSRGIRGGSWYSLPVDLRASYRGWFRAGNRDNDVGFRLVQDIP